MSVGLIELVRGRLREPGDAARLLDNRARDRSGARLEGGRRGGRTNGVSCEELVGVVGVVGEAGHARMDGGSAVVGTEAGATGKVVVGGGVGGAGWWASWRVAPWEGSCAWSKSRGVRGADVTET